MHCTPVRRYRPCRFAGILALLLLPLALVEPAQGIVVRHDTADSAYVVDAARYPQLFHLHARLHKKICMATLIAPEWAITAAHCLEQTPILDTLGRDAPYALEIAGAQYWIADYRMHPTYQAGPLLRGVDLALLRLDRAVPAVRPARLNRNLDEVGKVVQLLGWGHTGSGITGRRGNDGKFRRAENSVSAADQWLRFRFDDPREWHSPALPLEGVPGLGDSGGPALIETDAGLLLLGVALGELEGEDEDRNQGRYGATEIYERVSLHVEWIDSVLQASQISLAVPGQPAGPARE